MRSVQHGQKLSSQVSSGPPTALELILGAAIALLMLDRDRHRPAPVAQSQSDSTTLPGAAAPKALAGMPIARP